MAVGQPESDDRSSASIVAAVTRADRMAKAVPVQYTQSTQRADWITAEEAEALALEAVGLAREEVQFSRTEIDIGTSGFVWEVEFRHGAWEYDFTLDAVDGTVLGQSKEYDPEPDTTPRSTAVTPPPAASNTPAQEKPAAQTTSSVLTAEEAAAVALAHASLSKADVTHLKTEQDRDDGMLIWEVEFRQGRVEYEYESHAQTGKVLDWERDIED